MSAGHVSLADIVEQFKDAMRAHGIHPPDKIVMDGELHRFNPANGKTTGKLNAWFVLYGDGVPAGNFGDWSQHADGIGIDWRANIGRKLQPEEVKAQREAIEQARAQRSKATEQRRKEAAEQAVKLWNKARRRVPVDHPYLVAKGVRPYGLRQLQDRLVVPLIDTDGNLHGLQHIHPDGRKVFGSGTAKAGHFHRIQGDASTTAIVEGYATGATIRELMGWRVIVAFDAGNLLMVAKAIRKADPDAALVLCGDNDHRTKDNPGAAKARAAAQAVNARVAIPEFAKGDAGTDWNDYAKQRGAEATRTALGAALDRPTADLAPEPEPMPEDAPPAPAVATGLKPRFMVNERGTWYVGVIDDCGERVPAPPVFICSPLHILAVIRDTNGNGFGRLVQFEDLDGGTKRMVVSGRKMVSQRGDDLRGELMDAGLPDITVDGKAQRRLNEYLIKTVPETRARHVRRVGWHGNAFVLPNKVLGDPGGEFYYFDEDKRNDAKFVQAGTLEGWRMHVAQTAGQHKRLLMTMAAAFSGPLIHLVDAESGGLHIVGQGSSGKTTALRLASSVWGSPRSYWRSWNATHTSVEAMAEDHNDALLGLDEIGEADPRMISDIAYMLGNGAGKARGRTDGTARDVRRWRVFLLSTGEVGSASLINAAGGRHRAGHDVRMVEVPADAGQGFGVFDSTGNYADGDGLSRALVEQATAHHGHAGLAFVERIAADPDAARKRVKDDIASFLDSELPHKPDGQVIRVARRFGLIAAAGQLATEYGLTWWNYSAIQDACADAFHAWLDKRGTHGALEPKAMMDQVREFIAVHGGSRFQEGDPKHDGSKYTHADGVAGDAEPGEKPIQYRAGCKKTIDSRRMYLVEPGTFRKQVCDGFDHLQVCKVLHSQGMLKTGEGKGFTMRARVPYEDRPQTFYGLYADALG